MTKKIDFEMRPAGTVNSEESWAGYTTDGKIIIVEDVVFVQAPADERDDARYWENRYNLGEFENGTGYDPVYLRGER